MLAKTPLPEPYRLAQMSSADVPVVTANLKQWYPDVVVGMESPHLEADFYHRETTLLDAGRERALLPVVVRHPDDGIVAVITFEKNMLSRSISTRLGVLAPEHRRASLGLVGPILLEELGRAIGAELAYYFATLKSRHQQVIAERRGFQLVGIVPGYDRDMISQEQVKRVYEALYTKLLVAAEHVHTPSRDELTTRTRAVWKVLFGRDPK